MKVHRPAHCRLPRVLSTAGDHRSPERAACDCGSGSGKRFRGGRRRCWCSSVAFGKRQCQCQCPWRRRNIKRSCDCVGPREQRGHSAPGGVASAGGATGGRDGALHRRLSVCRGRGRVHRRAPRLGLGPRRVTCQRRVGSRRPCSSCQCCQCGAPQPQWCWCSRWSWLIGLRRRHSSFIRTSGCCSLWQPPRLCTLQGRRSAGCARTCSTAGECIAPSWPCSSASGCGTCGCAGAGGTCWERQGHATESWSRACGPSSCRAGWRSWPSAVFPVMNNLRVWMYLKMIDKRTPYSQSA